MKYEDGAVVRLGDTVKDEGGRQGMVVFSVDTAEYSAEFPESEWSYLGAGVMVRFDCGLVHYPDAAGARKLWRA